MTYTVKDRFKLGKMVKVHAIKKVYKLIYGSLKIE